MSASSTITTPSRVSAVSPFQWMRAFAYTPESARIQGGTTVEHRVPPGDVDALPTRCHRNHGSDSESETHVSFPLTVPTKRKRQSRGRKAPSLLSASTPDCLSLIPEPRSERRMKKARSRSWCTSPSGESRHGHAQGSSTHHAPAPSTCCPSRRRMVLDAVEIVSKKKSRRHTGDPGLRSSTESARKTGSSYYPSPPASGHAPRDGAVHESHTGAHTSHPHTAEHEEHASPRPTLPLKTSKYFVQASTSPTHFLLKKFPNLTPPSSPVLTIPVYIEYSDFEYPLLFDEPVECTVDESRQIPTWFDNPSLFGDLMIMLRRLKPILVQETVQDDPWKVLIAVRLLNVTTGKAAIPVFCKIMSHWPTPQDLVHAPHDELVELLRPLGLYNKRAHWLKDMSQRFLDNQCASGYLQYQYPGVGPYALDSLRIFCASDKDTWKQVMPQDKELVRYLRWRWAAEEGKVWYPDGKGVVGEVNVPYLITLVDELAAHYDGAIGGEGYMYHFCNDLSEVLSGDA